MQKIATELGLNFDAMTEKPIEMAQVAPPRIALWDRYGGSMPSGWTRWLFEQFEFPFTVIYPQTLDAGDLINKFDVIVFVTGAIPARDGRGGAGRGVEPRKRRSPESRGQMRLPKSFADGWAA